MFKKVLTVSIRRASKNLNSIKKKINRMKEHTIEEDKIKRISSFEIHQASNAVVILINPKLFPIDLVKNWMNYKT